ncbi:hypothetical protein R1sor_018941 [Riccia sorocarpa]|uniref:Uncharacterized protein n=1 Tax=Riccia sorocarpa TaxID=122646 RepID=A0ABD3IEG5_9MARC
MEIACNLYASLLLVPTWLIGSGVSDQGTLRGAMDPAEMIVPVFGIAAAAAITFYAVSFMEISEKSFEDLGGNDREEVKLRSSQSAKERRQAKGGVKQQSKEI